jgi:hypothetical protein
MPKPVEIPGVGRFEFPDSMSMDDIAAVIERDILPKTQDRAEKRAGLVAEQRALETEPEPSVAAMTAEGFGNRVVEFGKGVVRGAAETAIAVPEAIGVGSAALAKLTGVGESDPNKLASYNFAQGARMALDAVMPMDPELADEFVAGKLGQGIGSMIGFGGGGAAIAKGVMKIGGKKLTEAAAKSAAASVATTTSAGLGAAVGGVEGFTRAKKAGATDKEAFTSFLLNAGVGTFEAFGLEKLFSKANKASGGTLMQAFSGSSKEGLQEGFQGWMGNLIANVATPEEVELMQGVVEGGAVGAASGFLASILKIKLDQSGSRTDAVAEGEIPTLGPDEVIEGPGAEVATEEIPALGQDEVIEAPPAADEIPTLGKDEVIEAPPQGAAAPPRTLNELQEQMRAASPGLIGTAKSEALGALVKGVAAYKGVSPDEYVKSRFAGVVQGGEPSEQALFSRADSKLAAKLDSEETVTVYRAMQLIDGKLYPPMSAKVEGQLREPTEIGVWEKADERPELATEDGMFKLDKGNKTSVPARYNPYFHTSRSPLNDQFTSASKRPNLVTVEVEVPKSELTSNYRAEKAKDTVGEKQWNAGPVSGKLPAGEKRKVILSRYAKVVRVIPDSEVAQQVASMVTKHKLTIPENVITPSLKAELAKLGVNTTKALKKTSEGQAKASVEFDDDGKALIRALNATNVADMAHELGHVFRRDLSPEDSQAAEQWAGVKDGVWTREAEEKFAVGFERYLADGYAPTTGMRRVFEQFKQWLGEIYGAIKGSEIDVELSPALRSVLDKLVSTEAAPVPSAPRGPVSPSFEGEMQGMGAAVASEFEPELLVTGIKREAVEEARAARGAMPLVPPTREEQVEVVERVKAKILDDPGYTDRLVSDLTVEPRNISADEVATLDIHYQNLQQERLKMMRQGEQAMNDGRPEDAAARKTDIFDIEQRLGDFERMLQRTGSMWGRTGAMMQRRMNQDFTLEAMEQRVRAAKGFKPMNDADRAATKEAFDKIKDERDRFQKAAEAATESAKKAQAEAELNRIKADQEMPYSPQVLEYAERFVSKFEVTSKRYLKELLGSTWTLSPDVLAKMAFIGATKLMRTGLNFTKWTASMVADIGERFKSVAEQVYEESKKVLDERLADAEKVTPSRKISKAVRAKMTEQEVKDDILSKVEAKFEQAKENAEANSDIHSLVQQLARLYVAQGTTELNPLVKQMHEDIKAIAPDITERDVLDAFTGYGRFSTPSENEIEKQVRELKAQGLQIGKLEDLENKKPLKVTGFLRGIMSDTVRRLVAQVNEAKKKFGVVDSASTERHLQSALETRKRYVKNRIADMEAEIKAKKKNIEQRTPGRTDAELEELKARLEVVKAEYKHVFGDPKLSDEARLVRALAAAERNQKVWDERLKAAKEGKFGKLKPGATKVSSKELEAIQARTEAIREQVKELRYINQALQTEKAQAALERQETEIRQTIKEIEAKLATGDIDAKPSSSRMSRPLVPELEKAQQDLDAVRQRLAQARKAKASTESLVQQEAKIKKTIEDLNARIAAGDIAAKPKAPTAPRPTSPALEAAKKELKDVRDNIADARTLARREADTLKKIEEIKAMLKAGALGPKTTSAKMARPLSPNLEQAQQELEDIRKSLSAARKEKRDENTLAKRETAIRKKITEIEARIAAGDISTLKPARKVNRPLSPELETAKQELEAAVKQMAALREAAKTVKTPEQIAMQSLKARMATQTAKLLEKIANGDYAKAPKRKQIDISSDKEAMKAAAALQRAKADFNAGLEKYRRENMTAKELALDAAKEVAYVIQQGITSTDISAVFRQAFYLTVNPTNWIKASKAFKVYLEAVWSQEAADRHMASLMAKPNAPVYAKSRLRIVDLDETQFSKQEETARGRLANKIPWIKGSNRGFITFLNYMRTDTFDKIWNNITIKSESNAESVAEGVNTLSGYGTIGPRGGKANNFLGNISPVIWSPRLLASRMNLLTLKALRTGSGEVRKEFLKEYAGALVGMAALYMLVEAFDIGEVDWTSNSSDFGKIKVGNTRIDPLAGMSQLSVLVATALKGERTSTTGKKTIARREQGEKAPYGAQLMDTYIGRFLRSKLRPEIGAVLDALSGENMVGEQLTVAEKAMNFAVPLAYQDFFKIMDEQGIPAGLALQVLSALGVGIQHFEVRKESGAYKIPY